MSYSLVCVSFTDRINVCLFVCDSYGFAGTVSGGLSLMVTQPLVDGQRFQCFVLVVDSCCCNGSGDAACSFGADIG